MSVERSGGSGSSAGGHPGPHRAPIVHVLPHDLQRGAQMVARELCGGLDVRGDRRHIVVTLFDAPKATLGSVREIGVPSGRLRRIGFDVRAALRLRRLLNDVAPAAVVAHGWEPLKYVTVAARRTPVVYYRIGVAEATGRSGWRLRLQRLLARRAARVVAISLPVRDELVELLGVPPSRVTVIPNGRDPAIYAAPPRSPGGPVRFVFVGHLGESKRPDLFVELIGELRDRGLDVTGAIAGDGPLLGELQGAAAAPVDVLGPRDDVPQLLADADAFVFTSRVEGEGMPGVLIEAAMAGLPVVATRVPGSADVVVDGVTGFLVDPDEPRPAMFDAAERLARNEDLRRRMGAAAHTRAVARFGMDAVVDTWHDALEVVAAPSSTTR